MIDFLAAMGLITLYGFVLAVIIFLLQYLSKKSYDHLMKKYGESSIFLRKFSEADTWHVFVVVVLVIGFWYWITGNY